MNSIQSGLISSLSFSQVHIDTLYLNKSVQTSISNYFPQRWTLYVQRCETRVLGCGQQRRFCPGCRHYRSLLYPRCGGVCCGLHTSCAQVQEEPTGLQQCTNIYPLISSKGCNAFCSAGLANWQADRQAWEVCRACRQCCIFGAGRMFRWNEGNLYIVDMLHVSIISVPQWVPQECDWSHLLFMLY